MGLESPKREAPEALPKEEVEDPEKVLQAHVESVGSGTSLPTQEGMKHPKITAALKEYFTSMTEKEAKEFGEKLGGIYFVLHKEAHDNPHKDLRRTAMEELRSLLTPAAKIAAYVGAGSFGTIELLNDQLPLLGTAAVVLGVMIETYSEPYTNSKIDSLSKARTHLLNIFDELDLSQGKTPQQA